ncbi:MAG: hypothetical protein ACYC4L_20225 [Chloroflexota bacterium]
MEWPKRSHRYVVCLLATVFWGGMMAYALLWQGIPPQDTGWLLYTGVFVGVGTVWVLLANLLAVAYPRWYLPFWVSAWILAPPSGAIVGAIVSAIVITVVGNDGLGLITAIVGPPIALIWLLPWAVVTCPVGVVLIEITRRRAVARLGA